MGYARPHPPYSQPVAPQVAAGSAQIRYLAWRPDSLAIATDGNSAGGYVVYDLAARTRTPLFAAQPANGAVQFRQSGGGIKRIIRCDRHIARQYSGGAIVIPVCDQPASCQDHDSVSKSEHHVHGMLSK